MNHCYVCKNDYDGTQLLCSMISFVLFLSYFSYILTKSNFSVRDEVKWTIAIFKSIWHLKNYMKENCFVAVYEQFDILCKLKAFTIFAKFVECALSIDELWVLLIWSLIIKLLLIVRETCFGRFTKLTNYLSLWRLRKKITRFCNNSFTAIICKWF